MTSTHAARHSCLARNNDWRRHAQHLRNLAIRKHLSQESRERLLLGATIADACADEAERIGNELNRTSMAGSVACGTRSWRTA